MMSAQASVETTFSVPITTQTIGQPSSSSSVEHTQEMERIMSLEHCGVLLSINLPVIISCVYL